MKLSLENRRLLVRKVAKAVRNGYPMFVGFEWASKKFVGVEMNIFQVRSYWYLNMHSRYKDKLEQIKPSHVQKYNGGRWTKEEDIMVIETVKEHIVTGRPLETLLMELSDSMDRTQKAVYCRWYNVLKHKSNIKDYIGDFKQTYMEVAASK